MNMAGKMKRTVGKSILIGAFIARSSAASWRRLRVSEACTLRMRPSENGAPSPASSAELDALRAELAESLDRERDLRVELAATRETRTENAVIDSDFAARAAELDVRAARVASAEQELELQFVMHWDAVVARRRDRRLDQP